MSELERRIQAAMRAGATAYREVERIGPFTATFARNAASPFFNYAIPDEGAEPSPADVAALLDAYRSRGLRPRLEYLSALAPAVEPLLLEAGFAVEARLPLLVLARPPRAQVPEGFELVEAVAPADVRAAAEAQHEAYGEPEAPTDDFVAGVSASVAAGGLLVLARETRTGETAGAGQCTEPVDGASELTSVGVRPAFRRRGLAAAVTARLAAAMCGRGCDLIFLTAAGEAEARIYARVGFDRLADGLYLAAAAA